MNELYRHMRCIAVSLTVVVFYMAFGLPVLAQVDTPPSVTLTTEKQSYLLGEPVVLNVGLKNVSDEPQQYGPIDILRGNVLIIVYSGDEVIELYEDSQGVRGGWAETPATATLPGEMKMGRVVLTHHFPLIEPGSYTIELKYPITERVPTSVPGVFQYETVGSVSTTLPLTVVEPVSGPEMQAASNFAAAQARHLQLAIPDSTIEAAYLDIINNYTGSYLEEPAYFYLGEYRRRVARVLSDSDVDLMQNAVVAYQSFIQRYPKSALVEEAAKGLVDARYYLDPPQSDEPDPVRLNIEAVCGGNVYQLANFNEEEVQLRYEAIETGEVGELTLEGKSAQLLELSVPPEALHIFIGDLLFGATLPNTSSCSSPPSPPADDCGQLPAEADVAFQTTEVWATGYNAQIQLTNTGTEAIRGWTLDFTLDAPITNLWNGQLTGTPPQYTAIDAGHNSVIPPGQSASFGFQVQADTVVAPTDYALNEIDCSAQAPSVDVAFETTEVWATGYNAQIQLTNTGEEALRGWRLAFELDAPIASLWNGQLSGNRPAYTVTDAGHNGILAPGETVSFGFQVQSDTVVEPSDYDVAFWAIGP